MRVVGSFNENSRIKRGDIMSGYIMELRKLAGHQTLIQCGASIIIVNEKEISPPIRPVIEKYLNAAIEKLQ